MWWWEVMGVNHLLRWDISKNGEIIGAIYSLYIDHEAE